MAYSTSTATDVNDALDKLRAFAVANGWTSNNFSTDGSGKKLHLQKGSDLFFNLRSMISGNDGQASGTVSQTGAIYINGSTGYSGASAWYTQAGTITYNSRKFTVGVNGISGGLSSYHFFAFTGSGYDVIYAFFEAPAGIFQKIVFGRLDSSDYGGWTSSGQFFFSHQFNDLSTAAATGFIAGNGSRINSSNFTSPAANEAPGAVYGTVDAQTAWFWTSSANHSTSAPRCYDSIIPTYSIWNNSPNSFNSRPILIPIHLFVTRSGGTFDYDNTPFSPVGKFPNMYWVNMTDITPGATLTLGSDNFLVLPNYSKGASGSFNFGLAIKSN